MTAKREQEMMYAGLALLALSVATVSVWRAAGGSVRFPVRSPQSAVRSDQLSVRSPQSKLRSTQHVTRPAQHAMNYELIARRNLFRPLVENKATQALRRNGGTANQRIIPSPILPLPPPVPQSTIHNPQSAMRMVGMVDNGRSSVALLEEVNAGRYYTVKAGERVGDVAVVRVEATRVVVKRGSVVEELPLGQSAGSGTGDKGPGTTHSPNLELERRVTPKG